MARPPSRKPRPRSSAAPFAVRELEVEITELGARGDAVARHGGELFFVPYGVPGDRVKVRTVGKQGDGWSTTIAEIVTPSAQRINPVCDHFGLCGGCNLQQVDADLYRQWKVGLLTQPLRRVGIDLEPQPLVQVPAGSRRRAQFAFVNRRGNCLLGFHERGSHRVVDMQMCAVLDPAMTALLPALRGLLGQALPDAGGEVTITVSENGLDVLVEGELTLDLFRREQLAAFAETHDLARLTWQRPGAEPEPVARRRAPVIRFGINAVEPPPGAFVQPTALGEKAITQIILNAIPTGSGKVADLYAGCGSFSIPLAEQGTQILAIEGFALPMQALNATARQATLPITTETRDLARRPLLPHEMKGFKAVVFDPPRAGAMDQAQQLALGGPPVVVAVSCNPNTLARDLKVLVDAGYRVQSITPIDQFPFTAHLEAVAVLVRG